MNIKIDSRKVNKGDIFVAIDNGHKYIEEAYGKGAFIVCQKGKYPFKVKKVKDTRIYLSSYLKRNYYDEIKDIILIGITGTNGKTTSAYLIYEALNLAGIKTSYIGTIGFYIKDKICDLNNTTPELLDIYEMILKAKEENCKVVVMEVSSHSLSLNRVKGLLFDYVIFTNLTEDHLDYHKTFNNYFKSKKKLFKMKKKKGISIINIDDKYGKKLYKNKDISISKSLSTFQINSYKFNNKTLFKVNNIKYKTNLIGLYNIYNITNVIALLNLMNIKNISNIISKLNPPPGRMNIINYKTNKIIIDYAHTPDAVLNIINSVKDFAKSKIYVIIGCGGNRDALKRPIMASIATNNADYVILTSDNPRDENPHDIIKDMEKGITKNNYKIIVNRREAIENGVQLLKNNDILLLLGKGHETYQIIKNKKEFFDDKLEIKKCIRR